LTVPPLTWLYASATRPDVLANAAASEAHVVILDLEDSVSPSGKANARSAVRAVLDRKPAKPVYVRINGTETPWWEADVEALADAEFAGVVVPKIEAPAAVDAIVARLGREDLRVHCLIETALGVEQAYEIAAHRRVTGLSLGEADLRVELGADAYGLDWCRSRIVVAATAAGLPRPPQSVYPQVHDLDGLRLSCERGRALGHLGRTAVHPAQLPVIVDVYRPTEAELVDAREVVAAFESASAAFVSGPRFLDAPALRGARLMLELADAYGTSRT
jgi:citrate lyase subunit beta/citryl-CoA lyase